MEISSLIIGLVVFGLMALPVYLLYRSGKNNKNSLLKLFLQNTDNYGVNISVYDYWLNSMIGIDKAQNKLYFLRRIGNDIEEILIDLTKYHFKPVQQYREVTSGKTKNKVLEKIYLQFTSKDKTPEIKNIIFYDDEVNNYITQEVVLLEKWTNIIKSISNKSGEKTLVPKQDLP